MKSRNRLLIASACLIAAVSVGLNIWLYMDRKNAATAADAASAGIPAPVEKEAPVLQPVTMDFSGTAFADGSWKLTDETPPAFDLDKPFNWEQVNPQETQPPPAAEKDTHPGTRTAKWNPEDAWSPWRPAEEKLHIVPLSGFSASPEREEIPGLDAAIVSEARHPRSKYLLAPAPLK